jgi:hypothetical protein
MKVKPKKEDKAQYTKRELTLMYKNIPQVAVAERISEDGKKAYDKLKISGKLKKKDTDDDDCHKLRKQDDCPICLEELYNGDEIDHCKYSCGNPIHTDCFKMWCRHKNSNLCVWCNEPWTKKKKKQTKYVNLGDKFSGYKNA